MYSDVANIVVPVWWLLAWGGLVGLVFSTVGAAGGILASVGMISVFGIENPNLVKPMAQALTLPPPDCRTVVYSPVPPDLQPRLSARRRGYTRCAAGQHSIGKSSVRHAGV